MKTSFRNKLNENKYIVISAVVAASGLLARSCGSDPSAFGLPMCGEEASLFLGVNAAHAHCVGCYVAAAGLVSAFVAVAARQLKRIQTKQQAIRVKA